MPRWQLEVHRGDLVAAVNSLRAAQKHGKQVFLSFQRGHLELARGVTVCRIRATGNWPGVAVTHTDLIIELFRRRALWPERLDIIGTKSMLYFSHFSFSCSWLSRAPNDEPPRTSALGGDSATLLTGEPSGALELALEVLDDDSEQYPGLPQLLFACFSNGLPMWWPNYHPYQRRTWADPGEQRSLLLEQLANHLFTDSLKRPLTPSQRQDVATAFGRISSELRSMGFDTPD